MRPRINPITGLSEEDEQNSLTQGHRGFDDSNSSMENDRMAKKNALRKFGKAAYLFSGGGESGRSRNFFDTYSSIPGAWREGE